MRIGVFDSGIGGLTVLKSLIKDHPNNEYIYFGDTLNLPYGTKDLMQLENYADKIIKFLINKKVDIIVIACGTISSNLYNEIKDKYNIPIIDVLSPTFKYIDEYHLSNVGVLATPMTIKSGAFNKCVDKLIACPLFVPLIEAGRIDSEECTEAVKKYLDDLKGCNYIVLGCTHYPLLKNAILKYTSAKLIDMGQCVSKYIDIKGNNALKVNLYFSLLSDELLENVSKIIEIDYEVEEKVL